MHTRIGDIVPNNAFPRTTGSCDLSHTPSTAVQEITSEMKEAEKLGVSVEKLRAMKAYAQKLHRKHPKMKMDRLQRKVADHFKIKFT